MMKHPVHPGELVKHDCIEALGLTVTEAASALGVSRPNLSRLVNGRSGVSVEMAIRLSKAFGSRPELWLKMQLAYDLAQAQQIAGQIEVRRQSIIAAAQSDETSALAFIEESADLGDQP